MHAEYNEMLTLWPKILTKHICEIAYLSVTDKVLSEAKSCKFVCIRKCRPRRR